MSFSEFEFRRIQRVLARYCENQVPMKERSQRRLTYEFKGNAVLLREAKAESGGSGRWIESRVLELRRDPEDRTWSVHVANRSGHRQREALLGGWEQLEDLLDQISGEPTAIVWG